MGRSSCTICMAFSGPGGIRRPERDKRPGADELPRGSIRTEILPTHDRCSEAQPPRVPTPEPGHHSHALVLGQEALLRCERLPPDLDLQRRADPDVPDPVGVLAPGREDDCLVGLPVVPQDHGSGGVGLAGLASGVDQQQERVAQEPAPSAAIQRQRQPEDRKGETTRFPAKSQQWLRCPVGWVRCGRTPQRHHLRTGTNPRLVLTPSEHRRRYSSQRRKSFWGLIRPAPNADPSRTLTWAGRPPGSWSWP